MQSPPYQLSTSQMQKFGSEFSECEIEVNDNTLFKDDPIRIPFVKQYAQKGVIYNSVQVMQKDIIKWVYVPDASYTAGRYADVLHRQGGPAYIGRNTNGTLTVERWFFLGRLHREDGPAVKFSDGSQYCYFNGKSHRDHGPACMSADGRYKWFRHGKLYTPTAHEIMNFKMSQNETKE